MTMKYRVRMFRQVEEFTLVDVTADGKEEAFDLARETMGNCWAPCDENEYQPYVVDLNTDVQELPFSEYFAQLEELINQKEGV